jgi:hypothetical protein
MSRDSNSALVWAYPVDPVQFGAHLEAYISCKSAIQTLRLCHCYGNNAIIATLPLELIRQIEDSLFDFYVRETELFWERQYFCFNHGLFSLCKQALGEDGDDSKGNEHFGVVRSQNMATWKIHEMHRRRWMERTDPHRIWDDDEFSQGSCIGHSKEVC